MSFDVEIEDARTWPSRFSSEANENRELILGFHRERQRIDRLCEEDVSLRCDPPVNEWKPDYQALVDRLEPVLIENRIVCYHCTRLTPGEIDDINLRGLRILSPELVQQRFDQCMSHGHLSESSHSYLGDSETIQGNLDNVRGTRTGRIWFCPNRSTLQQSSGVYRLFQSWGGEAVYCGHEEDSNISHVLRSIGTPCIVKCALPFDHAGQFYINFTERFLSQFVSEQIEYPEPPAGFDLYTKSDVPPSGILEIIEYFNPEFETLTHCSSWVDFHAI
ncbi:protein of unknown function [uncultured Woeseiaceae bacterium]|uniref:Uncharacterized protein n=1 Tax=uncultured Woeseiaceae bacterium TaxID=1983305 RepID=A0A7D9D1K6_9GAMM|nr:protein of unknown function [uncultured Woeseiaceae bacterium]